MNLHYQESWYEQQAATLSNKSSLVVRTNDKKEKEIELIQTIQSKWKLKSTDYLLVCRWEKEKREKKNVD